MTFVTVLEQLPLPGEHWWKDYAPLGAAAIAVAGGLWLQHVNHRNAERRERRGELRKAYADFGGAGDRFLQEHLRATQASIRFGEEIAMFSAAASSAREELRNKYIKEVSPFQEAARSCEAALSAARCRLILLEPGTAVRSIDDEFTELVQLPGLPASISDLAAWRERLLYLIELRGALTRWLITQATRINNG